MTKNSGDAVQGEIRLAQEEFRAGRLDAAEQRIRRLSSQHSNHPEVLTAMAMIAAAKGDHVQAIQVFESSLALAPDQPEALSWAAYLCLNAQRFEDAERYALRLTRLDACNARGFFLLANARRAQDKIKEGLGAIDRALALRPDDPEFLVTKARLLKAWRLPALASECYRKAMALSPSPAAAIDLARIQLLESHPSEALQLLSAAESQLPPPARPHALIAEALTQLRRFEEAEARWRQALKTSPQRTPLTKAWAKAEIAAGRFDVAETLLEPEIESGSDPAGSFALLATGKRMTVADRPTIEQMSARLDSGELRGFPRAELAYALGKAYDDLGDYELAMRYFDKANATCLEIYPQRANFDPVQLKRFVDFQIDYFTADRIETLAKAGLSSELPLFVVGMMRSGTTLTETVLGAHTKVAPGGEQSFWTERAIDLFVDDGHNLRFEEPLAREFAAEYLQMIRLNAGDVRFVIDKNPENFNLAGMLLGLFSNSKMVQLKRNARDNLLSLWMTPMSGNVSYASNRSNLVFAYREHLRLSRHWMSVLPPNRIRTFAYEDLTSSPESTIRNMLEYLGLEPEEGCFSPERNERNVLTPSAFQVRQPIHRRSQQRWRNYEPWLREFGEFAEDE